ARQIIDADQRLAVHSFSDWPDRIGIILEIDDVRTLWVARSPSEAGLLAVVLEQVEQRERNVFGVVCDDAGGDGTGLFGTLRFTGPGAEVAKEQDAALAYDLCSDVVDRRKHAANLPWRRLIRHRAIGDRKMRLLHVSIAVDLEGNILHPC